MSSGTEEQVLQYIDANRTDLEMIAQLPDKMFNMLRDVLRRNPMAGVPQAAGGMSIPQGEKFSNRQRAFQFMTEAANRQQAAEDARMTDPAYAMAVEEDFNTSDPFAPNPFRPGFSTYPPGYGARTEDMPALEDMPVGMKRGGIMSLRGY